MARLLVEVLSLLRRTLQEKRKKKKGGKEKKKSPAESERFSCRFHNLCEADLMRRAGSFVMEASDTFRTNGGQGYKLHSPAAISCYADRLSLKGGLLDATKTAALPAVFPPEMSDVF